LQPAEALNTSRSFSWLRHRSLRCHPSSKQRARHLSWLTPGLRARLWMCEARFMQRHNPPMNFSTQSHSLSDALGHFVSPDSIPMPMFM
jgi:hypothetical protein